jgi:beta-lactamase class A
MKKLLSLIAFAISAPCFATNTPLDQLEKTFDGKIGVYAIDTNTNQTISHRSDERFPTQSTYKFIGAAALLKASAEHKVSLNKVIHYTKNDLISWQPVTPLHLNTGMSLEALAEATVTYSDTPAMNIITKSMGGPTFVSDFAHSIGNASFNITHYEGNLNSNPADNSDTSTPKDMAMSLKKILLGSVLPLRLKNELLTWMRNCTTGYQRIRAGTTNGFAVADKTGSGDYGVANDIGILWSPTCKPIVLSIYTIQNKADATRRDDILAQATKIVLDEFAKTDVCFKTMSG